jgi:hypothetical protein
MVSMMDAVKLNFQGEPTMVTPTLLESVRTLSVTDKLALIEAISQMLQNELQSPPQRTGHAKVEPLPKPDSTSLPAHLRTGKQDIKALIAELLSRPDPTPDKMLRRGIWKGVQFDKEDFRAAEWHPSEKELLGE